jgi:hypothetical protein
VLNSSLPIPHNPNAAVITIIYVANAVNPPQTPKMLPLSVYMSHVSVARLASSRRDQLCPAGGDWLARSPAVSVWRRGFLLSLPWVSSALRFAVV